MLRLDPQHEVLLDLSLHLLHHQLLEADPDQLSIPGLSVCYLITKTLLYDIEIGYILATEKNPRIYQVIYPQLPKEIEFVIFEVHSKS